MTVKSISDADFQDEVLRSDLPVFLDIYATWCPPCKIIAPILDQLAGEFADSVKIVKLNAEESPSIASQYKVQGVPTLIGFVNGQEASRIVGAGSETALRARLQELAAATTEAGAA